MPAKYFITVVNIIGLLLSLVLWKRHGMASFSRVKLHGPYKNVAHKNFNCQKTHCAVSAFFPADKEDTLGKPKKMWMNYHNK